MAAEYQTPILPYAVHQRIAFAEALTLGKTIFEWSRNFAAARDIENISTDILGHYEQKDVSEPANTCAA